MSKVRGVVLLVVAALLAALGGVLAATFGPSGTLQATSIPLETQPGSYALVADVVGVSAGFPGSDLLGSPTLGADSVGNDRLFVGIGSRADVDEYLAGVGFEAVRQEGSTWQSFPIPGNRRPKQPTDQSFWMARATGNVATVDFTTSNGNGTFVVMNAEAEPGVEARIIVGFQSKVAFWLGLGLLALGLLLAGLGIRSLMRRKNDDAGKPDPAAQDSPADSTA